MRRSCANHGQRFAHRPGGISSRLRAWTRDLVVCWIALAAVVSSLPPCWALDGADAGLLGIQRQREIATRQLERAHTAVEAARSAAAKSKNELDQFLAAHFETLRTRAAEPLPEPRRPAPRVKPPTQINREAEQLNAQINELKLRRDELLERYTDVHPEVADLEGRLGDLMLRLSALEPASENAESLAPGEVVEPSKPAERALSRQNILLKQQQMAAEQYQQHFERWQAAEEDLKTTLDAEERAAARLAAIQLPPEPPPLQTPPPVATSSILTGQPSAAPSVPMVPAALPAPPPPTVSTANDSQQQGSQPLALAALLIALAVAALAAVKLARSSNDVYFENIDDVAAALALPVVGVISPFDNAISSNVLPPMPAMRLARHVTLACELALAVIAFALVAYGVQNPAALWHACTHPLESLANIGRFPSN